MGESKAPNGDQSVDCTLWTGEVKQPLSQWLAALPNADSAVLAACEPRNGRERRHDLHGLFVPQEQQNWTAWDMLEVWLYFSDGRLHALANGQTTRWAAWCELPKQAANNPATDRRPPWCPDGIPQGPFIAFARADRKILLQWSTRRGLAGAALQCEKLKAYEYYDQGTLRWWRLEPDG